MPIASNIDKKVGSYVVNSSSVQYIAPTQVAIYMTGLKPLTSVNVFFDRVDVNRYVRAAAVSVSNPTFSDFSFRSELGGGVSGFSTDSNGIFCAVFFIPEGTFLVGDRELVVADCASYDLLSTATTKGVLSLKSFSYDPESTEASFVSTRPTDSVSNTLSDRSSGQATDTRSKILNPMCFSVFIGSDDTYGGDGMFVTDLDLYFKTKSQTAGITFDIRTMENGIPTQTVIPLSKVRLSSSQVNVSADSLTATRVTFAAPIYLRAGFEYAFTINPEASSPDYSIWTGVVGQQDVVTASKITRNWGEGALYTSTNGTRWVPIENEFVKFKLYRAKFTASNTAVLVNDDYEFLSIGNNISSFITGEYVYKNKTAEAGKIVANTTSQVILGDGNTAFFSTLTVGERIVVSNGTISDVVTVSSVANNSYITTKEYPRITSNTTNGTYLKTPTAVIDTYDPNYNELILSKTSSTNSTFLFAEGDTVIGVISNANAVISMVTDKIVNSAKPVIQSVVPYGANLQITMKTLTSSYSNAYPTKTISSVGTTYITDQELIVASKSNEIRYNSGAKSLTVTMPMASSANLVSPVVDIEGTSLITTRNHISSTSFGENKNSGIAQAKYVSKTVTLSEGLDSEDIAVYINAYRPQGTDIEVYAKIINASDPDAFDDKDWTILKNNNKNVYSDVSNRNSFKEYYYSFDTVPATYSKPGVITTVSGNNILRGVGTQFAALTQPNDVISVWSTTARQNGFVAKVVNNYIVATGTVSSNTSNTTVTGTGTLFTTASAGFVPGSKLYARTTGTLIGTVQSITNSTSIVLTSNASFAANGDSFYNDNLITIDSAATFNSNTAVYDMAVNPRTAFKDSANNGIVKYYNSVGTAFYTYKSFAIKIVLKSDTTYLVPRVDDLRAIALSV